MTVGSRGPVLLEDYHLLEKLAQFHRCELCYISSEAGAAAWQHESAQSCIGCTQLAHDTNLFSALQGAHPRAGSARTWHECQGRLRGHARRYRPDIC